MGKTASLIAAIFGTTLLAALALGYNETKEETVMEKTGVKSSIPEIDKDLPDKIETATFALG